MMNTKKADWVDTLGTSAAVGSGGFALGALMQEILRQREMEAQRKRQQLPTNALVIDLPRPGVKQAEDEDGFLKSAQELISNTLALLGGLPAGFIGTKLLYDAYKKKQTSAEINQANMRYMQALQALQQKTGELNTPLVNALCKAAAEQLLKVSNPIINSVPWVLGGLGAGAAANDFGWFDWMKKHPAPAPDTGTVGTLWKGTKDAWTTAAILTALGGAGAMIHANSKKQTRENPKIPSAVALNYEDVPPAATLQHAQ